MKRRTKKTSAIILLFIILAAFGSWFCGRVPEPEYDGKKLGTYLKNVWDWEGSRKAVEALGPRAVPGDAERVAILAIFGEDRGAVFGWK